MDVPWFIPRYEPRQPWATFIAHLQKSSPFRLSFFLDVVRRDAPLPAPKTPETLQPSLPTTSQRVWTMIPTLFYYLLAYMILMTIFNFLVHAIYIVIEFYRTMDMDSLLLEVAFGWTMIATSAILLVAAFHIWMLAQTLDGGNPQVPAWILALIAMVGEEV
jgi:hypothetical protein